MNRIRDTPVPPGYSLITGPPIHVDGYANDIFLPTPAIAFILVNSPSFELHKLGERNQWKNGYIFKVNERRCLHSFIRIDRVKDVDPSARLFNYAIFGICTICSKEWGVGMAIPMLKIRMGKLPDDDDYYHRLLIPLLWLAARVSQRKVKEYEAMLLKKHGLLVLRNFYDG